MQTVIEILSNVPRAYITGLLSNGALVALVYFVVWKVLKKRLQYLRIQLKQRADFEQIKFEIKNALLTSLIGAITSSIVLYFSTLGYTKLYTDISIYGPIWSIGCFFFMWLLDDAWFYWVHRLLHHKAIYRHIHAVHHHSIDVTPFTSMSFHIGESFLLTAWIFPVAFFIPIYAPVLGVLLPIGLFNNIKSHLGYELYPAWFNKGIFRFFTSSTHHNMHHSKFQGNYGVHFRFWDKLCGTEFVDYAETFDTIKARKAEPAT